MANIDSPRGLRPVRDTNGKPWSGATNRYFVPASDSTAIYLGGLVKLTGTGDAAGQYPAVTGNVAATDQFVGVVTSIVPATRDTPIYRPASTALYVNVADDPDLLFAVQEDSDGGALATTAIGLNAAILNPTAGDAATGFSSMELDSSTAATTATLDLRIVALDRTDGNNLGANADWLVRINNHAFRTNAAAGA